MAIAHIGLGSNLGDRAQNIERAVRLLAERGALLLKHSTIIETDPVGGPPQEKFLNAVIKIQTKLSPPKLLSQCQRIEKQLGRIRDIANGPRTIDLDILLYDQVRVRTPSLVIPHPRMFDRPFVMEPLCEIEPQLVKEFTHAGHPFH
jgi:2-amino-4-hydroxy-6-hydroxymethyldihydropteridine diphosphokinase